MNEEVIYKVIDIRGVFQITLEEKLNQLAKGGFKVITSAENFLILEKK